MAWRDVPVPVIAAIHGNCLGAGLQLALGADIRIATPDAKLSIMEAKWGLVPDMGGPTLLRELVGIDVAKELAMTGRVLTGAEAHALGLVTHVSESPLDHARALAEEIAIALPGRGGRRQVPAAGGLARQRTACPGRRAQVAAPRDRPHEPAHRDQAQRRRNPKSPTCPAGSTIEMTHYPNLLKPLDLGFTTLPQPRADGLDAHRPRGPRGRISRGWPPTSPSARAAASA